MFRKTSITTVAVIVALAVPTFAAATVPTTGKQLVQIVKDRKANTNYKQKTAKTNGPAHTQTSVGQAISYIGSAVNRNSQERAGYCAPIPMPRVGENDGLFLNLYADDASRALYLAAGLVDAKKDAVTGSLSC